MVPARGPGLASGMPPFDPFDPAVQADPYPFYRALRDAAPAHWSEGARCWVLSRHADVLAALHDPARFSNRGGNVIDDSPAKLGRTVGSVSAPAPPWPAA